MPRRVDDPGGVPVLKTDRFVLRGLEPSDTAALFPTFSDPGQCRFLTRPAFADHAELAGWLFEPGWPGLTWIAQDRSGAVAGRFVAVPGQADDRVFDIGYVVCADRQRQGIARECTQALIAHLFETGVRKLTAEVDAENVASIRLLERLGFLKEAHFREHEITHIGLRDVLIFGMLPGERAVDPGASPT